MEALQNDGRLELDRELVEYVIVRKHQLVLETELVKLVHAPSDLLVDTEVLQVTVDGTHLRVVTRVVVGQRRHDRAERADDVRVQERSDRNDENRNLALGCRRREEVAIADRRHRHYRPIERVDILLMHVLALHQHKAAIWPDDARQLMASNHPAFVHLQVGPPNVQPDAGGDMPDAKHHRDQPEHAQEELHLLRGDADLCEELLYDAHHIAKLGELRELDQPHEARDAHEAHEPSRVREIALVGVVGDPQHDVVDRQHREKVDDKPAAEVFTPQLCLVGHEFWPVFRIFVEIEENVDANQCVDKHIDGKVVRPRLGVHLKRGANRQDVGHVQQEDDVHLVVEDARRRLRVEDASPLLAVLQILFHLLPIRLLGAGEDLQIEVHELLKVLHFAGFLDAMRCGVFGGRRRRSAGIQRLFRLRSRLALDAAQPAAEGALLGRRRCWILSRRVLRLERIAELHCCHRGADTTCARERDRD